MITFGKYVERRDRFVELDDVVKKMVEQRLTSMSSKDHHNHVNYYYWNTVENKNQLINILLEKIKTNLTSEELNMKYALEAELNNQTQKGIVPRRFLEKFGSENINKLIKAGYDRQSIINAVHGGEIPSEPDGSKIPLYKELDIRNLLNQDIRAGRKYKN